MTCDRLLPAKGLAFLLQDLDRLLQDTSCKVPSSSGAEFLKNRAIDVLGYETTSKNRILDIFFSKRFIPVLPSS